VVLLRPLEEQEGPTFCLIASRMCYHENMPRVTTRALIDSLNETINEVLQSLLSDTRAVALLDYPNYANVGDSAIWLGEIAYLKRAGIQIAYTCDRESYSRDWLARRVGHGTILITGGGNLGDLWPSHQRFREAVIQAFPRNKIIQLPQTIHFKERTNLARTREIFNAHPDLTLLVRDTQSLELARNEFRAKVVLCPDMALALATLKRPAPPSRSVLWLSRTDLESSGPARPSFVPDGVEVTDWKHDEPTLIKHITQWGQRQVRRHPRLLARLGALPSKTATAIARQRLHRGVRTLSRGGVVITDRLHGHVLSLLLGIPHVILDNNNGKVRRFFETWTQDAELTHWADSAAEALDIAKQLVTRSRSRP